MDMVDETLTSKASDRTLTLSIRAAVSLGKKTLNRYYELTDSSDVYRIAMGTSQMVNYSIFYQTNLLYQCYTLVINSNTSNPQGGRRNGFARPRTWCEKSSRANMQPQQ